jgi:hypothetical protein
VSRLKKSRFGFKQVDETSQIYQVTNSSEADLEAILSLFAKARKYQKAKAYNLWPEFSDQLIVNEILENRHWKVLAGDKLAGIFSVLYSDPAIWKEKDSEPSVYLHRIVVSPEFKGKRLMNIVRDWAIQHARSLRKKYVRMDTWGDNETLRKYYIDCGFNYLGQVFPGEVDGKPVHYGGPVLSLFQIEV